MAFAFACGLIVANLYYAQPLTALIGRGLALHTALVGLLVTLTQLGYGAGLLVLVSLADLLENRRLILAALGGLVLALAASALATGPAMFLAAAFATGFCAAATQILVPFAAHLAPERQRGRTVGAVMSGLLVGIMLARPVASLTAECLGWRAIFWASSAATLCLCALLRATLPRRVPAHDAPGLLGMLASLAGLLLSTPLLRLRAFYQFMLFSGFSLFWTAIPLVLAGPRFGLGQVGIALFALAGAGGALVAPLAGRVADRGHTRLATACALTVVAASFLLSILAVRAGSLALLVPATVVLDAGVQANQVLGLRAIYTLRPEARGRLNAIYMAIVFIGGGASSVLSTLLLHRGGWMPVALLGAAGAALALAVQLRSWLSGRNLGGAANG